MLDFIHIINCAGGTKDEQKSPYAGNLVWQENIVFILNCIASFIQFLKSISCILYNLCFFSW